MDQMEYALKLCEPFEGPTYTAIMWWLRSSPQSCFRLLLLDRKQELMVLKSMK